jgi:hypothetical protein
MSVKLAELFNSSRRDVLMGRLDHASTLQDVADAIQNELEQFADVNGPYVNNLKRSELPIAMAILTLVKDSGAGYVQTVVSSKPAGDTTLAQQNVKPSKRRTRPRSQLERVVTSPDGRPTKPCVVVTLSSSIGASAGFFFGPVGAVIGAAVLGTSATVLVHALTQPENDRANPPEDEKISIDKQKICDGFLHLLERIDALVAKFDSVNNAPKPEPKPPTLASFPEVLQLFQHAWSAVRKGSLEEMAAIVQRQFPSMLRRFGLRVSEPSDDDLARSLDDEAQQKLVDVDFSELVTKPTLDYPPICADQEVVAKGRVLFPRTVPGERG